MSKPSNKKTSSRLLGIMAGLLFLVGMSKLRKARAFSSPPRTGFYWRVIVRRQTLGAV